VANEVVLDDPCVIDTGVIGEFDLLDDAAIMRLRAITASFSSEAFLALGKHKANDHCSGQPAALGSTARYSPGQGAAMTDYWVSKLFFDLQHDPALANAYRSDRAAVIDRYPIAPDIRQALFDDDVSKLAPLVNAYLLRFYFQVRGMPEAEFIKKLRAMDSGNGPALETTAHG
jgi:hypothetical protein